jgi:mono/diheme cytochrome c family protein
MHRGGQAIAALAVGGCISVTAAVRARPATLLSPVRGLSRTERTTDKTPEKASENTSENTAEKVVHGPIAGAVVRRSAGQAAPVSTPAVASQRALVTKYCISCHNQRLRTAGLDLDNLDLAQPGSSAEVWEKIIAKLRAGSMPPPGLARPDKATYRAVASSLEHEIDSAWEASPNPGRIGAVHRLNRAEYSHAIRDLFALDFDVKPLLPGDETADGSFDNFADVLSISTAHLERYMSVARQVTRLATGLPPTTPAVETFEIPLHVMQDDRQSEDLPLGSRGGVAIRRDFPASGEYLIKVRLQRQYQDYLKGMGWPQQLDVRLDGKLLKRFTVGGQAQGRPAAASYAGDGEPGFAGDDSWEKYMQIGGDAGLQLRAPVEAGPHVIGVSFVRELWEPEGLPQPLQRGRVITNDQVYMDYANVGSVQVGGPYTKAGPAADTPSRRAIFICQPGRGADERSCATKILSRLARLAYRRPVTNRDVQTLVDFFDAGRRDGGSFDAGIQFALERLLVDPDFLLRVHKDSRTQSTVAGRQSTVAGQPPAAASRLSDIEVASRLSFFLWSSIPDDRLLTLAERGQLSNRATLEQETRRMLADPRATDALVDGFAAQWLNLRRVEEVVVDPERYPNYDLSLLQAFQRETELFVGSTIHEDRSVVDLLNADYTFVNERLARHYGIAGIYGSRFRRVGLPNHDQRGGLLGEGALLATTSYPDRTSPVLRGKWLLNNILGLPVPPPPPGVDTNLTENKPGAPARSIRERLAQHRQNPSCNSCHSVIDPLGFALENFDVIGGWRTVDESGKPVDASGATISGDKLEGLPGLRALLLDDPEQFPRTVTEKLLAFALGRRLEYYDRPMVRKIVRDAAAHQYRWSSLILGIVESPSFLTQAPQAASN